MVSSHRLTILDPDRERAYLAYRESARRSIRKTADVTGIPEGTLMRWSREDGWQQRLRADDDRTIAAMRNDADLALLGKHDALIERAWNLAESATDERVQADMTKYLMGVLGYSPQAAAARAAKGQEHQLGADLLPATSATPKTTAELQAIVGRRIEGQKP